MIKEEIAAVLDEDEWEKLLQIAEHGEKKSRSILWKILVRLKKKGNRRESEHEIFSDSRWRSLKPDPAKNASRYCISFNATLRDLNMPYRLGGRVGILLISTKDVPSKTDSIHPAI